jgi:hypothetical protein
MKYITFLFISCLILNISAQARRPKKKDKAAKQSNEISYAKPGCSKQEIAQAVLAGTATVLANVSNIVKEPRNPQNVTTSVASMIAGIVNITIAALQNRAIDFADETAFKKHLIEVCQPLCERITEIVLSDDTTNLEIIENEHIVLFNKS